VKKNKRRHHSLIILPVWVAVMVAVIMVAVVAVYTPIHRPHGQLAPA
jgi:type IV secretory pathway component VirB8